MGLIKKMGLIGAAALGLVFSPIGFVVEMPLLGKSLGKSADLDKVESQSNLVCALNDKLSKELEQLNATTFEMGDYVVSTEPEDRQKKYEQIYDKVVSSFGKLETVSLITKEEFVNYMMTNGEELENYVNSEEFYSKIMELKNILQDETKTPEEKLYTLKLLTENGGFKSQESKGNTIELAVLGTLMFFQIANLFVDLFFLECENAPCLVKSESEFLNAIVNAIIGIETSYFISRAIYEK